MSSPRNTAARVGILFFFGAFLVLHGYLKYSTHIAASPHALSAKAGQLAPSFNLKAMDGSPLSLPELAKTHRLIAVNFWESWCGPCKVELPDLQTLYTNNKDKGLLLIGVYGNSSDASIQELVKHYGLTFPVAHETGGMANTYGITAVPTTVVIDSTMHIVRSSLGIDAGLQDFVEKYLSKEKK